MIYRNVALGLINVIYVWYYTGSWCEKYEKSLSNQFNQFPDSFSLTQINFNLNLDT